MRALLAAGAGVDATGKDGRTALIAASGKGHVEVVRVLLAAGAGVDVATNSGWTALIWACCKGHIEVVRALLAAGASKHHIANDGATAYSKTHSESKKIRELLDLAP